MFFCSFSSKDTNCSNWFSRESVQHFAFFSHIKRKQNTLHCSKTNGAWLYIFLCLIASYMMHWAARTPDCNTWAWAFTCVCKHVNKTCLLHMQYKHGQINLFRGPWAPCLLIGFHIFDIIFTIPMLASYSAWYLIWLQNTFPYLH